MKTGPALMPLARLPFGLAMVGLALMATGCVEDFPATSAAALLGDAGGRLDMTPDATIDPDAALRPDATSRPDVGPEADARVVTDAGPEPIDALADMPTITPPDVGVPDAAPDMACVPVDEICNGLDEDCDGMVDEDLPGADEPCQLGVGACARPGVMRCTPQTGAMDCTAMPGTEIPEVCNGIDDDCDAMIDEGLALGEPCMAGTGVCQAAGVNVCGDADTVVCDAQAGVPGVEICNALDDDCDGTLDEGFGLSDACESGVGACLRVGAIACFEDVAACDAEAGAPIDEICNDVDDDCDGTSDEGLGKGDDCARGQGECLATGENVCADDGSVVCSAAVIQPVGERCNTLDDDCDGFTDEDLQLSERCIVGVGECANDGQNICGPNQDVICSAVANPAADEVCDGRDNDCDGATDEGDTCAADAIAGCQVWLGWQDRYRHNLQRSLSPSETWANCPRALEDQGGDVRCTSTRGDSNYQSIALDGIANADDLIGVRFACDGGEISSWVQDHCEVFLAYGDRTTPAQIEALDPQSCGSTFSPSIFEPDAGCVRTGHDALFHPIAFVGGVNFDDSWGVALRCSDADLPDRAAGLQSSLLVHFALQEQGFSPLGGCNRNRIFNQPDWVESDDTACPLIGSDVEGRETCASSSADGQFHGVKTSRGQLGSCWSMGVAFKRLAPLNAEAIP